MSCTLEAPRAWQQMGEEHVPPTSNVRTWSLTAIDWSGLRSALMAAGIAVILPMINTYGIAVTNALCAAIVWISFGYVCCVPFFLCHPDSDVVSGFFVVSSGMGIGWERIATSVFQPPRIINKSPSGSYLTDHGCRNYLILLPLTGDRKIVSGGFGFVWPQKAAIFEIWRLWGL